MASNLGYIDRLGVIEMADVQTHLVEVWSPIGKKITQGMRETDLKTKALYAEQARDMLTAASTEYANTEISAHPAVKQMARNTLYLLNRLDGQVVVLSKKQPEVEVELPPPIFQTRTPVVEEVKKQIPWAAIGIGAGVVALAILAG